MKAPAGDQEGIPVRLVHYADRHVHAVVTVPQDDVGSAFAKPKGLWVSVEGNGDGWRAWCVSEGFGLSRLTHVHDVTLAGDARILRLSTSEEIDAFTESWGIPMDYGDISWPMTAIDWPRVARDYQGIIIAPYSGECRLSEKCTWYYGWDCASGCIWDAAAIDRIVLQSVETSQQTDAA